MNIKFFNKREEAKINMMDVVIGHFDDHADVVALNIGFKEAVDEVKPIITDIKANAPQSAAPTSGITATKQISKKEVSEITARIAGQIYAYAEKTGDLELQAAVDHSPSELKKLKDGELALRCQAIHDLGIANKSELSKYGVTTDKLADLQAAIDNYTQKAQKPRTAIADRSVAKAATKAKLSQADKIFKNRLDRLIEDYAQTHPDFVAGYKQKRIIVDPKTFKKETDATSGGNRLPE